MDTVDTSKAMAFPEDRLRWFAEARFGMFIHWGLYALLGRGEWAMSREAIPWREYEPLAERFTASAFDPRAWAQLARRAGMKYMVLTTKHHEGFCLWDSKRCGFNAVNSGAGRDLLAEFVEAVRAEGLKVGFYYSLGDWRHPDWYAGWQGDEQAKRRFVDWTHGMVHELMTGYGRIDVLFYDLPQCYSVNDWRSVELNAMVRSLQPQIIINNRALTTEDTATPEQHVSAAPPGRCWEACMTLNENWGYAPHDHDFKSPRQVVLQLAAAAAGCGNLLLNVGPDPAGRIPPESVAILEQVGEWLDRHAEAIHTHDRNPLMWYNFGPTTVNGHNLYC
ncbi:MAG: alpha-L-fucosidase, partial [Planctomycetes bacterium]|nr:alpha-L-fucosidase [Planctomycetota bacterium]